MRQGSRILDELIWTLTNSIVWFIQIQMKYKQNLACIFTPIQVYAAFRKKRFLTYSHDNLSIFCKISENSNQIDWFNFGGHTISLINFDFLSFIRNCKISNPAMWYMFGWHRTTLGNEHALMWRKQTHTVSCMLCCWCKFLVWFFGRSPNSAVVVVVSKAYTFLQYPRTRISFALCVCVYTLSSVALTPNCVRVFAC